MENLVKLIFIIFSIVIFFSPAEGNQRLAFAVELRLIGC
jgi:hypothetical protein